MHSLKNFGTPAADTITTKSFVAHQTMLDAGQPFGRRYYWKSDFFTEMQEVLIDTMIEHGRRITSPHSAILFMHLGGMPSRLDADLNAIGFRSSSVRPQYPSGLGGPRRGPVAHRMGAWMLGCRASTFNRRWLYKFRDRG